MVYEFYKPTENRIKLIRCDLIYLRGGSDKRWIVLMFE